MSETPGVVRRFKEALGGDVVLPVDGLTIYELRTELDRLRAENERLRAENGRLLILVDLVETQADEWRSTLQKAIAAAIPPDNGASPTDA